MPLNELCGGGGDGEGVCGVKAVMYLFELKLKCSLKSHRNV